VCIAANIYWALLKDFKGSNPQRVVKVIIQKAWLWTIIRNLFEECHALCTLRTSFNGSGRFGAVKSDSTHHFFRNACTKSGSLRFSQFSGCWLILSVCWFVSFAFPFGRLLGVREFCYYPYLHILKKSRRIVATTKTNSPLPNSSFVSSCSQKSHFPVGPSLSYFYIVFVHFWTYWKESSEQLQ